MSFAKWLSALVNRSILHTKANRRHADRRRSHKPRSRFTSEFFELEDRRLPAAFVPTLPMTGTVAALKDVLYQPELDPDIAPQNRPQAKLVTIMNNGSNVIFPIFDGTNTTEDKTAGKVTRAIINAGGEGYFGTFDVTFSLGSGANKIPARAVASGNGPIFSVTLDDLGGSGSGYQPGDQVVVTSITPQGTSTLGKNAVITAHPSNITVNGTVSLYNPKDPLTNTYRGYVGEKINGVYQLGLQPGHQVTVQVPPAFWDGGRIYMVDNGPIPLTSKYDPGYPLQANAQWSYNDSLANNDLAKLGAGRSFVVAPSSPENPTIYSANFKDPTTKYGNPDGVVMWYHELPHPANAGKSAAHGFGFGVPAVLTEATFRDPNQVFFAPNMRPDQIFYIDNYDVSYVDSLAMPASMEATQVPTVPVTPGSMQYAWTGADQSTTQMQDAIAKFTAQNVAINSPTPGNPNGLGAYFGGLGWDQFYMPGDNNSTATGTITQVDNSNTNGAVTIITDTVEGLVNGGAVTISDVTGPGGGQAGINTTWIIGSIKTTAPRSFVLTGLKGDAKPSTGGKWTAFKTTGVHLQKLPAGYDSISQSANLNVTSQFDSTRYNLVSGGGVTSVGTVGTGLATEGQNTITGVNTDIARQLVAGMLLAVASNNAVPAKQLFPYGTTIHRVELGMGANDSILVMNNKATGTGSPGHTTAGGSYLFFGSNYSTAASPPAMRGTIATNDTKITGLDPKVGMYLRPFMLVTGAGLQTASNTYVKSVSDDFTTVTLTQAGTPAGGSGPYVFVGSPSSYVLQALTNNWYAWADYYVAQLASGPNAATPTGTFTAKTRINTGRLDLKSLFLDITDANFDMNQLRVGDVVTSALPTTLKQNSTGTPATPGYDPSLNYTIVSFHQDVDPTKRWVELSLPVLPTTASVTDTFTFTLPQHVIRSSDAPAADFKAITSVTTTNGQPFTIHTASTTGLVNGMEVTISGVIDQATGLPAKVDGRWVVTNLIPNTSFQLTGAGNASGQTFTGGIWSTTGGTVPYALNFTPPTTPITGISNANGQPIVITTGSTVGLVKGQQVTIQGVTGQTGINGVWTIDKITTTTFELVGITGTGGPKGNGVASSGGTWASASALQFAQTVYDVMQTFSLLVNPETQASRSASLLGYVIGGNTGTFEINQGFKPQTGRDTLLPKDRTDRQLRDELKSVLRGVYDFNAIPDQTQWYPNPSTPTANATLNGSAIKFGIYNLDPYVWFIHEVLHNSSYGFSFDDDVANAQAASSTLQIAVGGNTYTAANPPIPWNTLTNHEGFSPFAQWGTQQSEGFIDSTSQAAIKNLNELNQITINGLSASTVARMTASNPAKDRPGAFITTTDANVLPTGVVPTIVQIRALPAYTQPITTIANPTGGTITINTAKTGDLGAGNLVTITGVNGQQTINGRWIVVNVVKDKSFDLRPADIKGDNTQSSGGSWTYEPSFVTFTKPTGYTPPTNNAKHPFTFSIFLGTTVPNNISPSVTQAKPGTVITVNGTGLTGVHGVSFNGYDAKIVGSDITSVTNTNGNPIVIGARDTTGLANGDSVTFRGVFDETTGQSSSINGRTFVIGNLVASTSTTPGSFTLSGQNSTGDGHTLVRGTWIAGTDLAVKVIVPNTIPNTNGSTHPGAKGKIGVRNPSGTNYSAVDFTIIGLTLPYGPIDFKTQEPGPQLSSNWNVATGGFLVDNDRLNTTSGPLNVAAVNLSIPEANVFVQAKVNALVKGDHVGLLARYSGPGDSNTYLAALSNVDGGTLANIWKNVNGAWSVVKSSNIGPITGGLMRFEVVGNSLKIFLDENLVTDANDSSITAPGLVGVRGGGSANWTNFLATVQNSVPTALSYGPVDFSAMEAGPHLSEQWLEVAGNFTVQGNQLQANPGSALNVSLVNLETPAADVFVEAKVTAPALNEHAGLLARASGPDDDNSYLGALSNVAGGAMVAIWKNVNGAWTLLSSANLGAVAGGTLRLEVVGDSLKLFFNGSLATYANDSSITAPGLVGVRGSAQSTFDDFHTDALDPIPTPLAYGPIDFQNQEAGPQLSEQWLEAMGNFGVQGNRMIANPGSPLNVSLVNLQTPAANVFVEATVNALALNEHAGLLARASGPGDRNSYLAALSNVAGGTLAGIWRNVNGVWTLLSSANLGATTGGLLRFEVVGNSLKLFFNGNLATFAYDSVITAAGLVGVRGSAQSAFDDFRADTLDPIFAPLPYGPIDFQTQEPGPHLSEQWIEVVGNLAVQTNQLRGVAPLNVATLNLPAPATSGFVEATVTAGAFGEHAGLLGFSSGPGDTNAYLASLSNVGNDNNIAGIWKNVAGTWTLLKSVNVGFLTTGLLRFELTAGTLTLKFNNNPAFTISTMDTSLTSGTFGVRGSQNAAWDDFSAGG